MAQGVAQIKAEFQPEQPDQRQIDHQKKRRQNRRCKEGDRVAIQVALCRAAQDGQQKIAGKEQENQRRQLHQQGNPAQKPGRPLGRRPPLFPQSKPYRQAEQPPGAQPHQNAGDDGHGGIVDPPVGKAESAGVAGGDLLDRDHQLRIGQKALRFHPGGGDVLDKNLLSAAEGGSTDQIRHLVTDVQQKAVAADAAVLQLKDDFVALGDLIRRAEQGG